MHLDLIEFHMPHFVWSNMCAHLGIQNQTEMVNTVKTILPGCDRSLVIIFSSIQARPWSFRAGRVHLTMDDGNNNSSTITVTICLCCSVSEFYGYQRSNITVVVLYSQIKRYRYQQITCTVTEVETNTHSVIDGNVTPLIPGYLAKARDTVMLHMSNPKIFTRARHTLL